VDVPDADQLLTELDLGVRDADLRLAVDRNRLSCEGLGQPRQSGVGIAVAQRGKESLGCHAGHANRLRALALGKTGTVTSSEAVANDSPARHQSGDKLAWSDPGQLPEITV